jgi:hypothetical protein
MSELEEGNVLRVWMRGEMRRRLSRGSSDTLL